MRCLRTLASVGSAAALSLVSTASAAPAPAGVPNRPPPSLSEREANNTFATRNTFTGASACRWSGDYFARLGPADTGHPDTVLGHDDILGRPEGEDPPPRDPDGVLIAALRWSPQDEAEAVARRREAAEGGEGTIRTTATNDDAGPWRRWGGSQLLFQREGPFGSVIRVTGKGCDPLNYGPACTHNQTGTYEVIISWFAAGNVFLGNSVFLATLSNNDIDEFPVATPAGTFDYDIVVKTVSEYTGDVDFFQINGLRPNEDYSVSTFGFHSRRDAYLDTILGQFSAAGANTATNDDIGLLGTAPDEYYNSNSSMVMRTDALGRLFMAVTGYSDFNFNGLNDPANILRHDESGTYFLRVSHVCPLGCADANGDCEVSFADITHVLTFFGMHCQ